MELKQKMSAFTSYAVEDGLMITGQNPASSEPAAEMILVKLQEKVMAG